jgi:diacylglycerol kinase (ATP)
MRVVVIANPASRGGWVRREAPNLERQITAELGRGHGASGELGPVEFAYTERAGDGTRLAKKAIEAGATTLVSLGGDGTHREVASGLLELGAGDRVGLGILNAGTGGDFRKLLEGGSSIATGCETIRTKPAAAVDAGIVTFAHDNGRRESMHFLNIASLGMGGLVDRHVARSSKVLGGKATYLAASLRAFFEYTPATVKVEIDGRDEGTYRISNICVCNGQFAGGGMHFAPQARLADGEFDVIILEDAPLGPALLVAKGLYDGSHLRSPTVHSKRGKHVVITPTTEARAYMDIDGEAPGVAPAEFTLLPKALRVHGVRPDCL